MKIICHLCSSTFLVNSYSKEPKCCHCLKAFLTFFSSKFLGQRLKEKRKEKDNNINTTYVLIGVMDQQYLLIASLLIITCLIFFTRVRLYT